MHIFCWVVSVLGVIWFFIWIDAKRTKAEGWVKEGPGMAKRFPKKTPVIERHEEDAFFPELMEDQNN